MQKHTNSCKSHEKRLIVELIYGLDSADYVTIKRNNKVFSRYYNCSKNLIKHVKWKMLQISDRS